MTWLLGIFAPVVGFVCIWVLAMIEEEKWERELSDEEWEE